MDHAIMPGEFSVTSIWMKKRTDDSGNELPGSFRKGAIYAHHAIGQDHKMAAISEIPLNTVQSISHSVNFLLGTTIR